MTILLNYTMDARELRRQTLAAAKSSSHPTRADVSRITSQLGFSGDSLLYLTQPHRPRPQQQTYPTPPPRCDAADPHLRPLPLPPTPPPQLVMTPYVFTPAVPPRPVPAKLIARPQERDPRPHRVRTAPVREPLYASVESRMMKLKAKLEAHGLPHPSELNRHQPHPCCHKRGFVCAEAVEAGSMHGLCPWCDQTCQCASCLAVASTTSII